ncbi:hypothetical protein M885DRAFT_34936 [Pelagophyceae sp. CCMP2097]|nr:hypothetical protein M885DRAFT_34936 [Pelagophyceae sp. CCMP2097]
MCLRLGPPPRRSAANGTARRARARHDSGLHWIAGSGAARRVSVFWGRFGDRALTRARGFGLENPQAREHVRRRAHGGGRARPLRPRGWGRGFGGGWVGGGVRSHAGKARPRTNRPLATSGRIPTPRARGAKRRAAQTRRVTLACHGGPGHQGPGA